MSYIGHITSKKDFKVVVTAALKSDGLSVELVTMLVAKSPLKMFLYKFNLYEWKEKKSALKREQWTT